MLAREVLYRSLANRRQLASYVGLLLASAEEAGSRSMAPPMAWHAAAMTAGSVYHSARAVGGLAAAIAAVSGGGSLRVEPHLAFGPGTARLGVTGHCHAKAVALAVIS